MQRKSLTALGLVVIMLLTGCVVSVSPRYGDLRGYVGIRVNSGIRSQDVLSGQINPEDVVISSEAFNDDNIMPLAGAKVYISGERGYISTGQDGVFRAYKLPVGWKTVTISHSKLRKDLIKEVWVGEGPNTMQDAIGGVGYYIVIGIDQNIDRTLNAPGAEADAISVADVFERFTKLPGNGKPLKPLIGSDARRANIEYEISNAARYATQEDYLVLYFAGHTGWDFLSPWDDTKYYEKAITDTELEGWLRKFPGYVTVILDGSDSATFADGREPLIRPMALRKPKYTVITSAKGGQDAIVVESEHGLHGLFSHYLIAGLSTPGELAKSDKNRDGTITAWEIFDYIESGMKYYQREKYGIITQEPELHVGSLDNTVILRY